MMLYSLKQVTLLGNDFLCQLFVCVYALNLSLMTILYPQKYFHENSRRDTGCSLFPYACPSDLPLKLFNM